MSQISKHDPEKIYNRQVEMQKQWMEEKGKIKLHSLSNDNFIKSREKYIRKKLRYFSVSDGHGTVLFWNAKDKELEFEIADGSESSVVERLRALYYLSFEDCAWALFHLYMNETARMTFNFIFDYNHKESVPILKKIYNKDFEDIIKESKKGDL